MIRRIGISAALSLFCIFLIGADVENAVEAGGPADASIGEMRVQTYPALAFATITADTTFENLSATIGSIMPRIEKAVAAGQIKPTGPFVMVYHGMVHHDPAKPFKVDIGLVVAPDGAGNDEVKVRKTKPFKCATILYSGPVTGIGNAWQKLIPAAQAAGLTPSGEEREFTFYYENNDSANNVVQIQLGVK